VQTFYEFVPDESESVLAGCIAGLDETDTVEGSLGLDVDLDAELASFVVVNATQMNPSELFDARASTL
jgi:hypothetical protein